MLAQQTLSTLRHLKLLGMADAYQQQLEQPATHDLAFAERFALLVDREATRARQPQTSAPLADGTPQAGGVR